MVAIGSPFKPTSSLLRTWFLFVLALSFVCSSIASSPLGAPVNRPLSIADHDESTAFPSFSLHYSDIPTRRESSEPDASPFLPDPHDPHDPHSVTLVRRGLGERLKNKTREIKDVIKTGLSRAKDDLKKAGKAIKSFLIKHKTFLISLLVSVSVSLAVASFLPLLPAIFGIGAVFESVIVSSAIGGAIGGVAGSEVTQYLTGNWKKPNSTSEFFSEMGKHLKKDTVSALAGGVGAGVGTYAGGKVAAQIWSKSAAKGGGTISKIAPPKVELASLGPASANAPIIAGLAADTTASTVSRRMTLDVLAGQSPLNTVGAVAGTAVGFGVVAAESIVPGSKGRSFSTATFGDTPTSGFVENGTQVPSSALPAVDTTPLTQGFVQPQKSVLSQGDAPSQGSISSQKEFFSKGGFIPQGSAPLQGNHPPWQGNPSAFPPTYGEHPYFPDTQDSTLGGQQTSLSDPIPRAA